jgi:protein-S-isoprenylcysteine O-methyltransferase Ste14
MNMDTAHRSCWEISEVIFGIPFLASIVLQWLIPLSLPQGILRQILIPVGIVLIIVGIGLIVLARREFAQYRQSMEPGRSISKIVRTGVFSISRNPLYLGIAVTLSGIALVFNALWILVFLIPALILCHFVLITPEERYLTNKFGEDYLAYTASVRRWLGRN